MPAQHDPGGNPGEQGHGPSTEKILQWLYQRSQQRVAGDTAYSPEDDRDFRPGMRPPVPVLTALDDGSHDVGEEFRLRKDVFTIGRTVGDLLLPHDPAVSGAHAEIRRTHYRGGFQWTLHDLGSKNGTFARCNSAVLAENTILILGAHRFRLANPLKPAAPAVPVSLTSFLPDAPADVRPRFVELAHRHARGDAGLDFPLEDDLVTIGRAGGRADITIDDPLLAYHHATLNRQRDGSWLITATHTRNGIWVSTPAVTLSSNCHFRIGEQVFRFVVA
jgi:hypothetical protein